MIVEQRLDQRNVILETIRSAQDLVGGVTLDTYMSPALRGQRRGVERCIEVVAMASAHLTDEVREAVPGEVWMRLHNLAEDSRNEYNEPDHRLIWRIVREDLEMLEVALRSTNTRMAEH